MKFHRLTLVALLCAGNVAVAQDSLHSKQFEACMAKPDSNTMSMIECMAAEEKRHDKALNDAYRKLQKQVSPERRRQLVEAQRLWVRYREANCGFYYDPDGGSMARLAANSCHLETTAQRAKELAALAEGQ